jgi:aspartate/methionine/tyrosine aminotransferase
VESLAQNLFIAPPSLPQHAALAVFGCTPELDGHVKRYRTNRDLLLAELPRLGIERFAPADGAFYLLADVGHLTNDSEAFCRRMLAETGVATTPGRDFDSVNGHRFLRLSFAGATAEMADAVTRLAAWRR